MNLNDLYHALAGGATVRLTGVSDAAEFVRIHLTALPSDFSVALARLANVAPNNIADTANLVLPPTLIAAANADYSEHRRQASSSANASVTIMYKDFRTCPIYVPPSEASDEDDFL